MSGTSRAGPGLVYLTAVAYHHPEKFDAYDDVLPQVEVPEVEPPGTGGADVGLDAGEDTAPIYEDVGSEPGGDVVPPAPDHGATDDGGGCSCSTSGGPPPMGVAFVVWACIFVGTRRLL